MAQNIVKQMYYITRMAQNFVKHMFSIMRMAQNIVKVCMGGKKHYKTFALYKTDGTEKK